MSWRSIQGQVSGGQKVTVVKSTLGGKEAVYNRLKQEYNKIMQDYVSCTDIPTFQAIIAGLKAIQDEISEATSALSIVGREWSDLLFLAQKLCIQSYIAIIKRCGPNEQSTDAEFAYQLALSNHLLMDEMGKDDLLVVKHTIFLAQRVGDEWTYRRLLNEYQDKFEGVYSYLLLDIPQMPLIGKGVVTLPAVPTYPSVDAQCNRSSQRHLSHLRDTTEAVGVFEALVQRLGSSGKEESSYSQLANLTADALEAYFSGKIVEDEEVIVDPSQSADIPMDVDEIIPESQLSAVAEEGVSGAAVGDPASLLATAETAASEKPELPKPERMSTRKNRLHVQSDGNSREAGNDMANGGNDVPQELQAIQSICDNWIQSMPELSKFLTAEGLAETFPTQEEVEDAAEAAKAAEVAQAAEEQAKKELESQREKEEEARRKRLAERGDEVREMPCLDWLVDDLRRLLELLDLHYDSPSVNVEIGRHLLRILSQWTSSFVDVPIGLVRYHLKTFPWAKLSIVALRCGAALLQWQRFLPSSVPFAFLELPDHASRLTTQVLLAECSIAVHMVQSSRNAGSYTDELSGQILHHLFSQWALDGTFDITDGFALRFRTLWVSMRWLFAKYVSVQVSSTSAAASKTTAVKNSNNNARRKKAGTKGNKDESGESESTTMLPLWITEMNMDFATLLQTILYRLRGMTQEIGDRTLYLLHTPSDWQTVDSFTLSSLITKGDQCLQQYLLNVSLEESRRMLDRDVHKQLESFDVEQLRKFIDSLSYDLLDTTDDNEDTADDRAFRSSSSTSPPWVVASSEEDAANAGAPSTGTMVLPLLMNFSGLLGDKRYGEAAKLIQLLFRHVHDLVEATLRTPSTMMNTPTASTPSLLAASSTHFQRGFRGFLRKLVPYVTWIWGNPSVASHVDTTVLLDIVRLSQRMFLSTYVAAQALSTSSSSTAGFVSAQTMPIVSMLWRVFVLVGRYASASLVPTNGEPSPENKPIFQSLVHDQLRPVAHRFLYEWLDNVLMHRSSTTHLGGGGESLTPVTTPRGGETLMAASVLTSLSRLGDVFLLSQCHHTGSTLPFALSNDECTILATTLLTDLAPHLLQQQKLQTDQNMAQLADLAHTIVLLVGSSLSRATDASTPIVHPLPLALHAEERFQIANFLDELLLDSLSSTDRFVAAMASLQDLTMPCLSPGAAEDALSVANFQDACVIVSHTCSVMYDFPIGGLNHLRAGQYQAPTITAMTRMYSLLKACGNMKSFTKSNLREAQQWIALQEVLQTAIIGRGPYRPQLQSFLNLDKWAYSSLTPHQQRRESAEDIPDVRQRQQATAFLTAIQQHQASETDIPVVVHVFADLLEINAITADMLPATDELLASLKEAYPYIAYVDDHTSVDAKTIAFVQYALEHLSYCPTAIDSWIQLLQRVEICVHGLSDFLFQHMDVIPAKHFLDRLYHRLWTMERGLEAREKTFQQDRLWKLDPECWMNEIIPAVEELYRLMTSEEHIDDYMEWLDVSMIKELWPHHVKASIKGASSASGTTTTASAASASATAARTTGTIQTAASMSSVGGLEDWMTSPAVVCFVKALLLTDLLKRLCEVLVDKLFHVTHALMERTTTNATRTSSSTTTATAVNCSTTSSSTEADAVVVGPRWDRKYYYCIEGYCVQKIMLAKNYAHHKDVTVQGPHGQLLRSLLPLMESDNYLDESLFAMIMTAKYRWQLRDRSTVVATKTVGKDVLALLARVQRLLTEDTQHNNYGKPSKVNASYYIASLRMKIALTWIDELLTPGYTAASSSPFIVVEDIQEEVMILRRENMGGSISGSDGSTLSVASSTGTTEAAAAAVPAIVDTTPEEYNEPYRECAPVLSLLWEIFVVAVKGLLDCRKRDIYHFRTHYRLSDAFWQLTKRFLSYGPGFLPRSVRQAMQSLGGWEGITVERGLAELHKLFERKRSQIVAMWSTDNPVQPWDVLLARICEFDALRRKYVNRYLQMVASCNEVDMAWQLTQQALTKIAYPAIHETLVSSVEAYLRMIQLQMDEHVLPEDMLTLLNTAAASGSSGGGGDDGVLLLPLEPQWQTITLQASLLHQHSRLYLTYLESCHQLYVGLQKRKAPVVYLQDEVEHVMKGIVQRLVPFSHAYEKVATRARAIEATWAQQRQVEQATTTDNTTSAVPQPMDVVSAPATVPMSVLDTLAPPPMIRSNSSNNNNNGQGPLTLQPPPPSIGTDEAAFPSTVSSMDLSVSGLMEGVTPRRDSSGGPTPLPTAGTAVPASTAPLYVVATLPTIPKVPFEAEWDTKDLLTAVVAILTVPKAATTTAGQSTTTGNKRGRPSQQSLNHDGTHDGPPPSKQARRSTSASQSTSAVAVPASNMGSNSTSSAGAKMSSMSGFGLLTDSVDDGYPCSMANDDEAMDEEIML